MLMIQFEALTKQDILITIIAVSAFLILLIIFSSIKRNYLRKEDFLDKIIQNNKKYEMELYQKLKGMVFGDERAAERLINMEQGRMPNESKMNLIKRAIERLEMDRR